ncbi:putative transcription regulator IWS1 family [Helianthus annuus]|nr:putative transcription regulator IWS1 family [Helianthus annuus]KAJ0599669.1 putative transcription regulator IWS1 family [Helianthus annuus]KAJ0607176.1 putative transcription regulator IWS1 family [Helianthus annuus]KAJ0767235.1 putative transcription regulator IWS1 family [Helianthus annuus]KAJ0773083.1 putative transcription regulator IWS1 family [Helianthus annuus]
MKGILNNSGYKTEGVLCDLLLKLKQMVSSMKVLEASMIVTSVSSLMKNESKDVRRTARMLVRSWRRMVDEWVVVNASVVQEKESNKKYQPPVVLTMFNVTKRNPKELQQNKQLKMVVLEKHSMAVDHRKPSSSVETMKPTKSVVPVMNLDKKSVEEKLEATKRKIHEHYKEAEKTKRQRRIQVIEVHDMLRLGLATKHQHRRLGKHISHHVVGSVR